MPQQQQLTILLKALQVQESASQSSGCKREWWANEIGWQYFKAATSRCGRMEAKRTSSQGSWVSSGLPQSCSVRGWLPPGVEERPSLYLCMIPSHSSPACWPFLSFSPCPVPSTSSIRTVQIFLRVTLCNQNHRDRRIFGNCSVSLKNSCFREPKTTSAMFSR